MLCSRLGANEEGRRSVHKQVDEMTELPFFSFSSLQIVKETPERSPKPRLRLAPLAALNVRSYSIQWGGRQFTKPVGERGRRRRGGRETRSGPFGLVLFLGSVEPSRRTTERKERKKKSLPFSLYSITLAETPSYIGFIRKRGRASAVKVRSLSLPPVQISLSLSLLPTTTTSFTLARSLSSLSPSTHGQQQQL